MIFPLQPGGFNLGVFHGSHLTTEQVHLRIATKVHIPYGCVILFHSHLYHYGDKACDQTGSWTTTLGSFSYIVEKDMPTPHMLRLIPSRPKIYAGQEIVKPVMTSKNCLLVFLQKTRFGIPKCLMYTLRCLQGCLVI